jgi:hypothetical protein
LASKLTRGALALWQSVISVFAVAFGRSVALFGVHIHPAESSETVRGDAPQWQAGNDESKESSTNEVFAERNNMTANARTRDLPAHHP